MPLTEIRTAGQILADTFEKYEDISADFPLEIPRASTGGFSGFLIGHATAKGSAGDMIATDEEEDVSMIDAEASLLQHAVLANPASKEPSPVGKACNRVTKCAQ